MLYFSDLFSRVVESSCHRSVLREGWGHVSGQKEIPLQWCPPLMRGKGGAWWEAPEARLLPPLMSLNIWWGVHAVAVISLAWIISAGKIDSIIAKFMYRMVEKELSYETGCTCNKTANKSSCQSFVLVSSSVISYSPVFPVCSPDFMLSFCFPHRNVYSLGLLNNKTEVQISGTVCCLSASAIPGDNIVNHTNSSALSSILF